MVNIKDIEERKENLKEPNKIIKFTVPPLAAMMTGSVFYFATNIYLLKKIPADRYNGDIIDFGFGIAHLMLNGLKAIPVGVLGMGVGYTGGYKLVNSKKK